MADNARGICTKYHPVKKTIPDTPEHRARIAQRVQGLPARLEVKLAPLHGVSRSAEVRMLQQASRAGTTAQRIQWLRRAADAGTQEPAKLAACRRGCNHCCHQAVVITKAEAQQISKETGIPLNPLAGRFGAATKDLKLAQEGLSKEAFGRACVFLKDGGCSIYAHRPLTCRWHLNMDDDDLLCQLVEGDDPPDVPYLDMTAQTIEATACLGLHQTLDDIREWFKPL